MICEKCGTIFFEDYRKDKQSRKTPVRFCSRACSNSRKISEEQKEIVSKKLTKSLEDKKPRSARKSHVHASKPKKIQEKPRCYLCGDLIKKQRQHKSGLCSICFHKKVRDMTVYRHLCKFTFNVYDYPEEFSLNLLDEYGWYTPANRGGNLDGISRDHKISVNWGMIHNVDPYIISHPANCELMHHKDNNKKKMKCSISLEELEQQIKKWNEKYDPIIQGEWEVCKTFRERSSRSGVFNKTEERNNVYLCTTQE